VSVQVPRAKPLEVERDIAVSGAAYGGDDLRAAHDRPSQIVDVHFEASDVAVVADAQLIEAQRAQRRFGPADSIEDGEGHRRAVRDAGRETGGCRLVPRAQ